MPCGNTNMPAPKLAASLPDWSNFRTTFNGDIAPAAASQQLLAPHRSATQMNLPSGDTSTALVDPHVRPSGSLKYPSTVWYGFGRSLVGDVIACAKRPAPASATAAAVNAAPRVTLNRSTRAIE